MSSKDSCLFKNLSTDVTNWIYSFLQRTDQIAWKLTSTHFNRTLNWNEQSLSDELDMYARTIDELEYAWKGDKRYINTYELHFPNLSHLDLLKKYTITSNLWYWDFNASFNIYEPGEYIIFFLSSWTDYVMSIDMTSLDGEKNSNIIHNFGNNEKLYAKRKSNKSFTPAIVVNFEFTGIAKVNCREIKKCKHNYAIQYMMCIPTYYWNKLKKNEWNKKMVYSEHIYCKKELNYEPHWKLEDFEIERF